MLPDLVARALAAAGLPPSGPGDTGATSVAVAVSGGVDSMVLLDLLASQPGLRLTVLHVHHGLHAEADGWLALAREAAARVGAAFDARRVQVDATRNIEEGARQARYAALRAMCAERGIGWLATAHHQDDQIETVLLQLMRGAGPAGLAGMAVIGSAPGGVTAAPRLLRPLLAARRAQIEAHARAAGLRWADDPSNADQRLARNALRHEVMPRLAAIRPGMASGIARSARLLGEAAGLLDALARIDLAAAGAEAGRLPLAALRALDPPRAANLLRVWLRDSGTRAPTELRLHAMLRQLAEVGTDNRLRFYHDGMWLRAWRGQAWLDRSESGAVGPALRVDWHGETVLAVPAWQGRIVLTPAPHGVPASLLRASVIGVRPRAGGERIRLHPRRPSQALKQAFQQAALPPWRRHGPVIWLGDAMLAVAGLGMDARWLVEFGPDLADASGAGDTRYLVGWQPD